jgi:guanine nucleotide-binding protein subunit alpha
MVPQDTVVRIRRFWKIYCPQGAQLIELTYLQRFEPAIHQQMRLIHRIPFSSQEVEHFRCCIFNNLTHGIKHVLDWMEDMQLALSPENGEHSELIKNANELRDGEVFPQQFYEPFRRLWNDRYFQRAWEHRNGPMLQEKYTFFSIFLLVAVR